MYSFAQGETFPFKTLLYSNYVRLPDKNGPERPENRKKAYFYRSEAEAAGLEAEIFYLPKNGSAAG